MGCNDDDDDVGDGDNEKLSFGHSDRIFRIFALKE